MDYDDRFCPEGPAGNTTIVQQDEAEILNRTAIQPYSSVETAGYQESEAH
ncbi:hypothetical protein [Streptomyces hoynatensis]|nr:hypothetical protein [Streptomyces hoynatensis]